ncbi:MAG TPA: hypothetical protein PKE26_13855 [Kiritimatiellia bacterium]|nr:hypothetical protein [Kiritimatiellia bacterium]HMP00187.1 hypothetical protein [Kiritimatiellia bacterium]
MAADTNGIIRVPYTYHGDRLYKWAGSPVGHTLVKANGWEYDFQRTTSPRYRLVRVRDGQGATWTMGYYSSGKLKRIENDFGRWWEIDYTVTNNQLCISGVRSSDGREISFDYQGWVDGNITNNILVGVNYPDGTHADYS